MLKKYIVGAVNMMTMALKISSLQMTNMVIIYIQVWVGRKMLLKWFYANFIHVDVKRDGKVWIQHDGTDLRVAKRLVTEGVDQSDIVIGFHPPQSRV